MSFKSKNRASVDKVKRIGAFALAMLFAISSINPISASAEETESFLSQYSQIENINDDTVTGMDFSYYQVDQEWGKTYYNYKKEEVNVFEFVKSQGVNTISVKAFVDASKASGNGQYFSIENAAKTIKLANEAGLATNVILYYSNDFTWASTQTPPEDWNTPVEGSDEDAVIANAKAYTVSTLGFLKDEGAVPSIVTIGNELDYNFLGYSGDDAWKGWKALGDISWIIKNFDSNIKVSIGIADKQNDPNNIKWVLEKLNQEWNSVQYDYVALNVYGYDDLNTNIATLKDVFVSEETAAGKNASLYIANACFPRKNVDDTATIENQADSIYKLLNATISDNCPGGLVCENAEFVGSWDGFFDNSEDMSKGVALPSLAIFAYARGNKVDISAEVEEEEKDPYRYGLETGLKDVEVNITKVPGMTKDTMRGVDVSTCVALENAGVKFYDDDGVEQPLFKVLSDHGINYVRIRIWNDPFNEEGRTYGAGTCDVATGLEIAKEANKYDMKVFLDFMYSDFWADPTLQTLPKAWKADKSNHEKMEENIYEFTKAAMEQFVDVSDVGMVQIGNEITSGICEVLGNYKVVWGDAINGKALCNYLNAGSKAVREVSPDTLVALQLESPNISKYTYIMDIWEANNVDYDVLASSCYPFWRQYAENIDPIIDLAKRRGKLFVVAETSWMNTLKDADGTTNQLGEGTANTSRYEVGPQGQADWLAELYNCITSKENGLGAFYWEPAWIPVKAGWENWEYNREMSELYGTGWATSACDGYYSHAKLYYQGEPCWGGSSWDNQTLFDFNGHPLKSLDFYIDSWDDKETQDGYIVIQPIDENNENIADAVVVKGSIGDIIDIDLPEVEGYKRDDYKMTITIEKAGLEKISVAYSIVPKQEEEDKPITPDDNQQPDTSEKQEVIDSPVKAKTHMAAKAVQKNGRFVINWSKVDGAGGYKIYMATCGKQFKLIKTVKSRSILTFTTKRINKKKNYKILVVAYKKSNGKVVSLNQSSLIHIVGSENKKYANPTKLILEKNQLTVKKGKTVNIKAEAKKSSLKKYSKKKLLPSKHVAKFRYVSSDSMIANVDKKGVVTGKTKGTCFIYVIASNGIEKKIKITVE